MDKTIVVLILSSLAASPVVTGLNLADVPCGTMAKGSRRYFQRVVGGSAALISDFPYAVSLKKHGEHFCGGSLLNRQFVVTAAHCVHGYAPDVWTVSVGDQNTAEVEQQEQVVKVESIIRHPDYKWPKYVHDIALLRLATPVEWNDRVQPVCLPDPDTKTNIEGVFAYLAGWGFDNEADKGGKGTDELHVAKLPVLNNEHCQKSFQKAGKKVKVMPEHLCAGHEDGHQDGCQGDSGGGLVSAEKGQMQMLGLMSAGVGCGRPGMPGMYTRIEKYVSWLQKTVTEWRTVSKRDTDDMVWWTGVDPEKRRAVLQQHFLMMMDTLPQLYSGHQFASF